MQIDREKLIEDFEEGDLLYGLEKEARNRFRNAIEEKIKSDRLNNRPERVNKKIYITIDDIHDDVMQPVFFNDEYGIRITPLETPPRLHMREFLKPGNPLHPSLAVKNETLFDSPDSKKLAASCKLALITHKTKIRFCLDGLNMDALRNPGHRNFRGFTSQELRYCAINWDNNKLKLRDRVVFYLDGQRVEAPWAKSSSPMMWLKSYKVVQEGLKEINNTPMEPRRKKRQIGRNHPAEGRGIENAEPIIVNNDDEPPRKEGSVFKALKF